jgi:nitroreductase
MSIIQAIRNRRSQKRFTTRPVSESDIKALIEAAVLAPNHKMTQPWGFVVLGPRARHKYAEIKAADRVKDETDAKAAAEKRERIVADISAVPAVIVVTQKLDTNPARVEEDYAAVFMGIENMLLMATSMGLGSKIHTGGIMLDPDLRALVGAADDERVVAIVHFGEPAEEMPPKNRIPASDKTRWLP